jgi:predicted NUDIX family phosphoesterase
MMSPASTHLDEYVMVVPTDILYSAGSFEGLLFDVGPHMSIINDLRNVKFIRRVDAESDPTYKQIIPYAILMHEDTIFSYFRGKLLSEERLRGKHSIGVGGHISPEDLNLFVEAYMKAMYREIGEEIIIDSKFEQQAVGLLNDDSNDVGKVHLGIVHLFSLEKPLVQAKEKSINQAKFVKIPDLKKQIDKYESWSQICIEQIDRLVNI